MTYRLPIVTKNCGRYDEKRKSTKHLNALQYGIILSAKMIVKGSLKIWEILKMNVRMSCEPTYEELKQEILDYEKWVVPGVVSLPMRN
ncbi:MAG: hypothetical protein NC907_04575 [Candidatus Omnitrophica bacterium]|nr:hypothetical protein [Candidatus Omnitrophota bacterium]